MRNDIDIAHKLANGNINIECVYLFGCCTKEQPKLIAIGIFW